MLAAGYDEIDIDVAINDFKKTNSFEVLPNDISSQFKMLPYVMKYEVTDELKNECNEYIDNTINKWESLGDKIENYPPLNFIKTQKNGKEILNLFYCTKLCSHRKTCKYLHDFIDKYDSQHNNDEYSNLF